MAQQTFDIESITLDEVIELEIVSGRDFGDLMKSRTGRTRTVLYLLALRQHARDTSQPAPEWQGSYPMLRVSESSSDSSPDGDSTPDD